MSELERAIGRIEGILHTSMENSARDHSIINGKLDKFDVRLRKLEGFKVKATGIATLTASIISWIVAYLVK